MTQIGGGPSLKVLGVPAEHWDVYSKIMTAIGGASVVLGIWFGYVQYKSQVEARRAEETLRMIEVWEDDGYRQSFADLREARNTFMDKVPSVQKELAEENPRLRNNLRNNMLAVVFADPENIRRFEEVIYYFNRLGLCVEAKLCSEATASIFFDDTLGNFLSNFQPRINASRRDLNDYAEGLRHLEVAFERGN